MENRISIYIRVDASPEIGLGHLIRCISLAHMLEQAFNLEFYMDKRGESFSSLVMESGFSVVLNSEEKNFFNILDSNSIVILDGYHFNTSYQQSVINTGAKLICIDDIADQELLGEVIINHGPQATKEDYNAPNAKYFLLGTEFALIRPIFFVERDKTKVAKHGDSLSKVLICFGGSDYKNLTYSVLSWIPNLDIEITLVVGSAYLYLDSINTFIDSNPNHRIRVRIDLSAEEFKTEFLNTDLAILPSSGVLMEAIALGVPIISGYYTENQLGLYRGFLKSDIFYDAVDFSKENFLKAWNSFSNEQTEKMIWNQFQIIDGNSPKRVMEFFIKYSYKLNSKLREARLSDMELFFKWANESEVRANAFNSSKIEWENHTNWFESKILSDDCQMFVLESHQVPLGQIRFDKKDSGYWEIDYSVDSFFRGFGYGSLIIQLGIKELINKYGEVQIVAKVLLKNTVSLNIFERNGFKELSQVDNVKTFYYE